MAEVIKMDYDDVVAMADRLGTAATIIQTFDIAFTVISGILIATGFGAPIGNLYLNKWKKPVGELAAKCEELDGDLKQSAEAYRNGDARGATKFF